MSVSPNYEQKGQAAGGKQHTGPVKRWDEQRGFGIFSI